MTRNLVIVRAGQRSTHATWMRGSRPDFDLIVAAYEPLPDILAEGAADSLLIPGSKVAGWSRLFAMRPDLLQRYDRIALLDDDLVADAAVINAAFALGETHQLAMWQPSLTWTSHFSYAAVLRNPAFTLRYVNFIEMMCPFFTQAHLLRCLPLFDLHLETGIDRLWCRLRQDGRYAYAVIDAVSVEHARPVGRNRAQQGFDSEYQMVLDRISAATGIPFGGPVAYAGIARSGRLVKGRAAMSLGALVPLLGTRSFLRPRWSVRKVFDHARHNLTRPIANDPLDVAQHLDLLRSVR